MAWQYQKGLQEIGDGIYAYLQPDGSWGSVRISPEEEFFLTNTFSF